MDKQKNNIFICHIPAPVTAPVVFDSPHSGTDLPEDFGFSCTEDQILRIADLMVDDLFAAAPSAGAALLVALFPRAYIDPNRAPDDVDEELLEEPWPDADIRPVRSRLGAGLIRRFALPGQKIYSRALTVAEVQHRIERYYKPYHAKLKALLDRAYNDFGVVYHLNCHSMGGEMVGAVPANIDVVLGTRDGTSCAPEFTDVVFSAFQDLGYRVAVDAPYKGVELVRRYSAPSAGRHSLQIELNRDLYLDRASLEKTAGFDSLKRDLDTLILRICSYGRENIRQIAAE